MGSVSGSDEESVHASHRVRGDQQDHVHLRQSGRSPTAGASPSAASFSGADLHGPILPRGASGLESSRPSRRRESSARLGGGSAAAGSLQSVWLQLRRSFSRDLSQVAEALGVHRSRKWLLGMPILQNMRQAASSLVPPFPCSTCQPLPQCLPSMQQVPLPSAPSWRALIALALVLTFLWWVASDSPPDCSLLPAIHPANACSYSDVELVAILNNPRGFRPGEPRYYFNGRWVDFLTVQYEMEMWKPHPKRKRALLPPCILCSVEGQLPCLTQACIIPLYIRPLTTDLLVLKQHLEDAPQILAPLQADQGHKHFATVLDGGANIGISTALMAFMFPHARIVAVEASQDNWRILRLNTLAYPNVIAIHAALWSSLGPPLVVQRDVKGSGYALLQVTGVSALDRGSEEDLPFGVAPPVDVPFLLSLLGLSSFDLLRMDVEGAEMEVLSSRARGYPTLRAGSFGKNEPLWWASLAKMAIISTHEGLVAGSEQLVRAAFPLRHFSIDFGPACSIFRRREVFQGNTTLGI